MSEEKDYSRLRENMRRIRERINEVRTACGIGEEVRIVVASKYADPDEMNYLHEECGVNDFGENRVQSMAAKLPYLRDRENLNIHFIGRLQTNKVKYVVGQVDMIHSLDSVKLAAEIAGRSAKRGIRTDVLAEINSGAEESKGGVLPGDASDFCAAIRNFDGICLRGFMTMAPKCEDKTEYERYFRSTYALAEEIWRVRLKRDGGFVLSMGMSDSYDIAVKCGSNCVRIGSAVFKT